MTEAVDGFLDHISGEHDPGQVEDAGGMPPDATYQCRLDKIYFKEMKDGKIKCVMEFEVMNGKYAHRTIFKWCNMDNVQNLDWLTRDLRMLGVPVNFKWNSVQKEHFSNLLDKPFEIEVKTKGEFTNVYIKKALKADEVFIGQGLKNGEKDVPF
ncbi:MAG TPA: hypothetical protein DDX29_12115 [Clostridiales bacterium]|nr:hypothetical protein [Clostridiales bacterium]